MNKTRVALALSTAMAATTVALVPAHAASSCSSHEVTFAQTSHLATGVTIATASQGGNRYTLTSADLRHSRLVVQHARTFATTGHTKSGVAGYAKTTKGALVTVNGDYFVRQQTRGPLVVNGSVLHLDKQGLDHPRALTLSATGTPQISFLHSGGRLQIGTRSWPIAAVNSSFPEASGVLVYTAHWRGPKASGLMVKVGASRVVIRGRAASQVKAALRQKIVVKDKKVTAKPSVTVAAYDQSNHVVKQALGIGNTILDEGRVSPCTSGLAHPTSRTAIGWSRDGQRMFIITAILNAKVSVRNQGDSPYELAVLLARHGAATAVLLDGGGSTAIIVKHTTRNFALTADSYIRPTPSALTIATR